MVKEEKDIISKSKIKKSWYKRWWVITLIIIVLAVLLIVRIQQINKGTVTLKRTNEPVYTKLIDNDFEIVRVDWGGCNIDCKIQREPTSCAEMDLNAKRDMYCVFYKDGKSEFQELGGGPGFHEFQTKLEIDYPLPFNINVFDDTSIMLCCSANGEDAIKEIFDVCKEKTLEPRCDRIESKQILVKEEFELDEDETYYSYFSTDYNVGVDFDIDSNNKYVDVKVLEIDECYKMQNRENYKTEYQQDHRISPSFKIEIQKDMYKRWCLAITNSEAAGTIEVSVRGEEIIG